MWLLDNSVQTLQFAKMYAYTLFPRFIVHSLVLFWQWSQARLHCCTFTVTPSTWLDSSSAHGK